MPAYGDTMTSFKGGTCHFMQLCVFFFENST